MDSRLSIVGIPHKYVHDDAAKAYQAGSLFEIKNLRKVGNLGQGLLGGCSPEAPAPASAPVSSSSLAKRAWKVLTFPVVWLVRKIVDVFKKIFPCLFKSEDKNLGRDKSPKFCRKTVTELIADLTYETDSLKKCVESRNLDELYKLYKSMGLKGLEARMQILRDLQAMHFEIVQTFITIDEMLSDNWTRSNGIISAGQKNELKRMRHELNAAYAGERGFKEKLRDSSTEIVQLFHEIKKSMTLEKMEHSDLWSLRSYLSILKFVSDHIEELFCNQTPTDYLDLAVEPSQEYLAILHIETIDPIKDQLLKDQIQEVIDKKVQELLEAQEAQKKALGAASVFLPNSICNVGNSCYMNSTLQALFGSSLVERLNKDLGHPEGSEDERRVMQRVRDALNSFKNIYDLEDKELREKLMGSAATELRRTVFESGLIPSFLLERIYRQQDAAEFMEGLLKAMGFRFDFKEIKSGLDGEIYDRIEKTNLSHILHVPISSEKMSFQKVIENFKVEDVDDPENKWSIRDDADKELRSHIKYRNEFQITGKIPDVMIVQLKRFAVNTAGQTSKINSPITWDSDAVDLSELIDPSLVRGGVSTKYRIVSYVNHTGGVNSGHYTANVCRGNHFYKCDDESPVVQVSEAVEKYDREHAYLFVLERVDA